MSNFWIYQSSIDILTILILLMWATAALIISKVPGLLSNMFIALVSNRGEDFRTFITRFMSQGIFVHLSHIMSALGIAIVVYNFYLTQNMLSLADFNETIAFLAFFTFIILAFFLMRRIIYHILGYIFLKKISVKEFLQQYYLLEWVWYFFLLPTMLLTLLPETRLIAIYIFIFFFVVWRILVCISLLRINRSEMGNPLHLFLYLCAHEILPFVYAAVGINYLVNSNTYLMIIS